MHIRSASLLGAAHYSSEFVHTSLCPVPYLLCTHDMYVKFLYHLSAIWFTSCLPFTISVFSSRANLSAFFRRRSCVFGLQCPRSEFFASSIVLPPQARFVRGEILFRVRLLGPSQAPVVSSVSILTVLFLRSIVFESGRSILPSLSSRRLHVCYRTYQSAHLYLFLRFRFAVEAKMPCF